MIAAIVVICVCPAAGVGLIALGAAKGLLAGALIGGIIGGVSSVATGNSFLDGFEDGAFSGALTGALFGGIGGAGELTGQLLGKSCTFIQNYGSVIKNGTTAINVLNFGMAGFDTVALITGIFDPDSKLVQLNRTLHESKIYNGVQLTLGALGAFGSGMVKGIKYDIQNGIAKCFIAGTLISTANGLVAIENIKAGDKVLSTNEITKETEIKTVVETYVRETMKLIHIRVSGEEIVTTEGHPFYVKDIGFVNACDLIVGEELVDISGKVLLVEDIRVEYTPVPVKVYNFQVEDYHTYYVGELALWVHNATYPPETLDKLENTENFTEKAIEHIFNGEVNKKGRGTGYHYDGIEGSPGKIIDGTRGTPNEFGIYEGKVEVNGVAKTANKGISTFFPEEMTPQQVVDTINEAYDTKVLRISNQYQGIAKNGMKVNMYLDSNSKIISAFPEL